jgi:hypothetical protein
MFNLSNFFEKNGENLVLLSIIMSNSCETLRTVYDFLRLKQKSASMRRPTFLLVKVGIHGFLQGEIRSLTRDIYSIR